MRTILGEHRRLWSARNRVGGLQDSEGVFEERLQEGQEPSVNFGEKLSPLACIACAVRLQSLRLGGDGTRYQPRLVFDPGGDEAGCDRRRTPGRRDDRLDADRRPRCKYPGCRRSRHRAPAGASRWSVTPGGAIISSADAMLEDSGGLRRRRNRDQVPPAHPNGYQSRLYWVAALLEKPVAISPEELGALREAFRGREDEVAVSFPCVTRPSSRRC